MDAIFVILILLIFRELSKNTKFVNLAFIDPQKEKSYHVHVETCSSFTLLMFLIIRLAIGAAIVIVLPR